MELTTAIEAVYEALKKLIVDPDLRTRLGEQAKEDAIKHFRYNEKVDQHLVLYDDLKSELKI